MNPSITTPPLVTGPSALGKSSSQPIDFSPAERAAFDRLLALALDEDLSTSGDVTTRLLIPADLCGAAMMVARKAGVIAGLPAARGVFQRIDPDLSIATADDGTPVQPGDRLMIVRGRMASILAGERTALNFVQRLSGVATLTRRYVDEVAGLSVKLLDTRKTTPGWRLLEKYAVRCGGGHNHRVGLYDAILIKDNHLAALAPGPDAVAEAVLRARSQSAAGVVIEVEVDNLDQLDRALQARPEIVLLDNMSLDDLREAVRRRAAVAPEVLLEASGGVSLYTVRGIAETGVDRISVGALTHSAVALDIGLDYLA
jgi:nicotinate-nucleotide pyrophosphorylase (carboxylating)